MEKFNLDLSLVARSRAERRDPPNSNIGDFGVLGSLGCGDGQKSEEL